MKFKIFFLFVLTWCQTAFPQTKPFDIFLEPITISGLAGLQAYAFGQHNGVWLLVGGRLDGLHRRQPFAAFDIAGNNNQLIVVDPISKQKWTAPLTSLSVSIREHLSSTNMQFHQEGDFLYVIGGYGYHAASGEKITFNHLTAIDVPAAIQAVISANDLSSSIRQISDPLFAVTGGHLKKINDSYFLIGGHKFDGDYNPMGHATYVQTYTNAIRKFKISDDRATINILHTGTIVDETNLHRRDYNAVSQIMPNGEEGITAFSGVFQVNADLPFLNSVDISSSSYTVNNSFQQYFNHYHCAVLPLYSDSKKEMHNVFFGGIAQYYYSNNIMVQDNNVPFVKTIARVTRDSAGRMAEYKLPLEMPNYLGSSSEFIPNKKLAHYDNEVIKLDELFGDTTMVGYIFGGIQSTDKNIFFSNSGLESNASNQIFKVHLIKNSIVGTHDLNEQSIGSLKMQLYPNPNNGEFTIRFHLNKISPTKVLISDIHGNILEEKFLDHLQIGLNYYRSKVIDPNTNGNYIITLESGKEKVSQKIVIDKR